MMDQPPLDKAQTELEQELEKLNKKTLKEKIRENSKNPLKFMKNTQKILYKEGVHFNFFLF